jgi:hypothetical protein
MPADVQLGLFPDWVCKVDELALDFDQWCTCVMQNDIATLTEQQCILLTTLASRFDAMSRSTTNWLWTEQALHTAPEWEVIRCLARDTLVAFGWNITPPPSYGHEFVPST